MTIKDDLHALIDRLDEVDAREALAFLEARAELPQDVSRQFVQDCVAGYEDALSPRTVRLPHESVRIWLQAWGTPDEAAADEQLDSLERRLANEARDATAQ